MSRAGRTVQGRGPLPEPRAPEASLCGGCWRPKAYLTQVTRKPLAISKILADECARAGSQGLGSTVQTSGLRFAPQLITTPPKWQPRSAWPAHLGPETGRGRRVWFTGLCWGVAASSLIPLPCASWLRMPGRSPVGLRSIRPAAGFAPIYFERQTLAEGLAAANF